MTEEPLDWDNRESNRIRADLSIAVEALKEAESQIKYLHFQFQETGSGNQVLAKIRSALDQLTRDRD